ncbi:hypothetical protein JCM8547_008167 [Rhodosporidiobolus lusitaniae]
MSTRPRRSCAEGVSYNTPETSSASKEGSKSTSTSTKAKQPRRKSSTFVVPPEDCRLEFSGVPGVYNWVSINGKPAPVYDVVDKGVVRDCYIEAKEDDSVALFSADMRKVGRGEQDERPKHSYGIFVYVDGLQVNGIYVACYHAVFESAPSNKVRVTEFSQALFAPHKIKAMEGVKTKGVGPDDGMAGQVHFWYRSKTFLHDNGFLDPPDGTPPPSPGPSSGRNLPQSTSTASTASSRQPSPAHQEDNDPHFDDGNCSPIPDRPPIRSPSFSPIPETPEQELKRRQGETPRAELRRVIAMEEKKKQHEAEKEKRKAEKRKAENEEEEGRKRRGGRGARERGRRKTG